MPHKDKMITDLLLTLDEDYKYSYQSHKLICKLRAICKSDESYIFYKQYPKKMYSLEQKLAHHYSFLINSLLLR